MVGFQGESRIELAGTDRLGDVHVPFPKILAYDSCEAAIAQVDLVLLSALAREVANDGVAVFIALVDLFASLLVPMYQRELSPGQYSML